jgi:PAS domain S-box-containing protein
MTDEDAGELAQLRDQTARLKAELAALTRERDRLWNIANELMSVAGQDGYLIAFNPAWTRALGYDEATLRATPFMALGHPEEREAGLAVMAKLANGESIPRYRSRMRHADGTYRWFSWTVVPEGGLYYAIGRDMTQERATAQELAAANRQLLAQIRERERVERTLRQMQRLEAIGQLTSGVAHDFNNLLTVVLGNIQFLERELKTCDAPPAAIQRVSHMRAAAERGAKLTSQLLAFSRQQRLEPKPIDLNATVEGMRDLVVTTLGGAFEVALALADDLWPARVDATQLELVILNLAINARDAMGSGGRLTLATANAVLAGPRHSAEPAAGDYVMLSVSDTGHGMSKSILDHAFEPFFTTKEIGRGSGLGLSQVLGFARQSGGGVTLESEPGEGCTVRVYFPRAAAASPEAAGECGREGSPAPEPDARILLVDDEAAVREVTAATLREEGYEVVEAGSGGAALERLQSDMAFHLALVDFAMPGMNGAELAREMKARRPSLPILFITGYGGAKALARFGEARIIVKPFVNDELLRKVRAALAVKA